ncbi:TetR/AcrR family transcriptional regulator [Photobacterium lutimaris]|uniref:TetR/AcrR family transcriptional regulator n=1 Tax=Photobacterium lutimaris TaxID=388278 RepID=A0A2T3IW62_9GAMM|nr:TetR/AcrR family transcriptional regulator [Photobacterium lutimaris]PSU32685.1 TetR/AcrR family transcriptional regulator [Photobacterium lutimaris]TDR74291.1 TetR family transcriptional regulator [Photobacterium lutimaris]
MDTIAKKTRTRLSPEKRKEQLLSFALDVFARRGIGRAGHADIADMANVSVATVFNYFPTREALVEEVLTQVEQRFKLMMSDSFASEKSLENQLTDVCYHLIDQVIEQQDWIKVWFEWSTSVREDIWPLFVSSNKDNFTKIADRFEQANLSGDFSPSDRTWQFQGLCYVLYLQTNITPEREEMQALANSHIKALLKK